MATRRGFPIRLWSFLLWTLRCQFVDSVSTESYTLANPRPYDGATFTSCVYVLDMTAILDPLTGLVDQDDLPSGSLLTSSYTTECVSSHKGRYDLDIEADTQTPRVQLSDTSSDFFDAFLPLPTQCLGTDYVVSTWSPGGTAFIALYNPNDLAITLNISLGSGSDTASVVIDDVILTQTHGNVVQLEPGDIKYVTSSSQALDGVVVSSSDPVGVLAGNTDTTIFGFGLSSNFLEMIPPKELFSDEYVVPLPPNSVHAVLKVISLSEDSSVEVTLTSLLEGSPSTSTTTNTLTELGDTWTHSHSDTLHVQASGPVMAVQYIPEASLFDGSSMTLVPPTTKWVWSAVLYPLTSSTSGFDEHLVVIHIKTIHVADLIVYNLYDGSDMTSSVTFTAFDQSEYSHALLTLDTSTILLIQHTQYQAFQVVQYGSSPDVNGLYSFPAAWNTSCQLSEDTTSASPDTSTVDTPHTPDTSDTSLTNTLSQNYVYVVTSGAICLVSIVIIVSVVCMYYKNKGRHNGDIVLHKNKHRFSPHETSRNESIFIKGNNFVADTAKRRDIELPRLVHVKEFNKLSKK